MDQPLAEARLGTAAYHLIDGLGSVTSLSSPSGVLSNEYIYDTFGKMGASSGALVNPLRYTAREFDQELGLYYYRARYYDQNAGRFLSEDLLRFPEGNNFYGYYSSNGVQWTEVGSASVGLQTNGLAGLAVTA